MGLIDDDKQPLRRLILRLGEKIRGSSRGRCLDCRENNVMIGRDI